MAITDIGAYTHLSQADIEAVGAELDAIRSDIEESLGERDAAYIRRTIRFQRTLDVAARLVIACSRSRAGWLLGTASLAFAKCVENMEIGHNVCHGQWDWMNDPEIHSSTWEWDMVGVSAQWRYSHNYRHHVFSNVVGVDDDLGLRHDAGDPRRAVATRPPAAATAKPVAGSHLRMGYRAARRSLGAGLRSATGSAKIAGSERTLVRQDRPPDRSRTTCYSRR